MAIDSVEKRQSALLDVVGILIPDETIGSGDRLTLLGFYSGIVVALSAVVGTMLFGTVSVYPTMSFGTPNTYSTISFGTPDARPTAEFGTPNTYPTVGVGSVDAGPS